MNSHELAMLSAINAARVERGLHALAANTQLADAAERHAQDMATHPGIVHTGSDGSSIEQRIREAGYALSGGGIMVVSDAARKRYAEEYYALFSALTALDAMCEEFPAPMVLDDPARIPAVRDLRLRVQAPTACRERALEIGAAWE